MNAQLLPLCGNEIANSDCHQVVIFTDALAVLQALKSGKLPNVRSQPSKVAARK